MMLETYGDLIRDDLFASGNTILGVVSNNRDSRRFAPCTCENNIGPGEIVVVVFSFFFWRKVESETFDLFLYGVKSLTGPP